MQDASGDEEIGRNVADRRSIPDSGPVVVAALTVADVELVTDDRKQHRMSAVQELPVFDSVEADVGRDLGRPTPIPARAMAVFRLGHQRPGRTYLVCSGT